MTIGSDSFVMRQVFFNNKLEVIDEIDPPEKASVNYLKHLAKNLSHKITEDNVGDFVLFLEDIIIRSISGYFSYKVVLSSHDDLDRSTWRHIRDRTYEVLERYESDNFGTKGKLFYPVEKDRDEVAIKLGSTAARLSVSSSLKKKHKDFIEKIDNFIKAGASTSEIAKYLQVDEHKVKEYLFSDDIQKPKPSMLAAEALVRSDEAKKLGLGFVTQLQDTILRRSSGKAYPKRKRLIAGKRIGIYPSDEEIENFLGLT